MFEQELHVKSQNDEPFVLNMVTDPVEEEVYPGAHEITQWTFKEPVNGDIELPKSLLSGKDQQWLEVGNLFKKVHYFFEIIMIMSFSPSLSSFQNFSCYSPCSLSHL